MVFSHCFLFAVHKEEPPLTIERYMYWNELMCHSNIWGLFKHWFGIFATVVEVLSECCLLSYMARVENRLSFLFRLINIINVQTLTQVCLSHLINWTLFLCELSRVSAIFYILMEAVILSSFLRLSRPLPLGECELFKHQFGHLDAGQKKGQTAFLSQRLAWEGVCWEVSGLPAQQLPQPTALLAASLPQQGQRQHLSGKRE